MVVDALSESDSAGCFAYLICRKSKAIEFMVVDALVEAEPALRISEKIFDRAEFQLLDDSIIDVSQAAQCFNWC